MIPTLISAAFWHDLQKDELSPAKFPRSNKEICWLDQLLGGGLLIPNTPDPARARTILLTGPPGTGKSTLATELCYRWSLAAKGIELLPFNSYYATTEAHRPWLVNNARRFWGPSVIDAFDNHISVAEYTKPERLVYLDSATSNGGPSRPGLDKIASMLGLSATQNPDRPDVIVIDSLNVVPDEHVKSRLFMQVFQELITGGPKIVIFVIDSAGQAGGASEFWEYICDIVIRMDRTHPVSPAAGYMLRTIEIVKARYQQHAWGPHQLKIYESSNDQTSMSASVAVAPQRFTHPFRAQGGIFIYPSVHYLLSLYKRSDPAHDISPLGSSIPNLTTMLANGFPQGRCTAFLGIRGGHKSYLGFMHILDRVLSYSEGGLIVSLRDDVSVTISSINQILLDKYGGSMAWEGRREEWDLKLQDIWQNKLNGRLEIMYFPPGNITPEEFLNRILISVLRFRKTIPGNLSLLFNSLDQLSPRFPLCAAESVFIAGLAQILSAYHVTSLFIAASEQDATYHGLESIAELILEFRHETALTDEEKMRAIVSALASAAIRVDPSFEEKTKLWLEHSGRPDVVIRVARHAGGHAAGGRGILELVDEKHPLRGVLDQGLQFLPLG